MYLLNNMEAEKSFNEVKSEPLITNEVKQV